MHRQPPGPQRGFFHDHPVLAGVAALGAVVGLLAIGWAVRGDLDADAAPTPDPAPASTSTVPADHDGEATSGSSGSVRCDVDLSGVPDQAERVWPLDDDCQRLLLAKSPLQTPGIAWHQAVSSCEVGADSNGVAMEVYVEAAGHEGWLAITANAPFEARLDGSLYPIRTAEGSFVELTDVQINDNITRVRFVIEPLLVESDAWLGTCVEHSLFPEGETDAGELTFNWTAPRG